MAIGIESKSKFDYEEFFQRVMDKINKSDHDQRTGTVAKAMTIVEIRGVAHQLERIADSLENIDRNTKYSPWEGGPK